MIRKLNRNWFRELIDENLKLKKEKDDTESQLHSLKNELNSSKQHIEKLQVSFSEFKRDFRIKN